MRKSRYTESQIIAILKEVENGMKVDDVCRQHGMSPATYYKWKSKYGGMDASELKRVKELEADFALMLEYKTVAGADSGVYLRGAPQVQIWDTTKEGGKWKHGADKGSGGLWNNSKGAPGKDPLKKMDKPFGEWNTMRILMKGQKVTVWLNGEKVVDNAVMENYFDRKNPIFDKGPIQLQTHGGEIRWRNIFIKELK